MNDKFDAFIDSLMDQEPIVRGNATPRQTYPCGQCAGTGKYQGARVHQEKDHCFACRGKGYFFSSYEDRLKAKQAARARAKTKLEVSIAAFEEQEPVMFADLRDCWRSACESGNSFIYSLAQQLFTRGSLTEKQVAAWHRGKQRLEEIRAQRAAEAEERKVANVDLTPIRTMFDHAKAAGLKRTTYRAEGLVLKAAADHGRNPGALYVTSAASDEYLGKLIGTTFHPVRSAPATVGAALLAIAQDPKEAAVRWGRQTGTCSCCGRELTDPNSIALGIGPVCAQKWGFQ